jgi:hypothetical protein
MDCITCCCRFCYVALCASPKQYEETDDRPVPASAPPRPLAPLSAALPPSQAVFEEEDDEDEDKAGETAVNQSGTTTNMETSVSSPSAIVDSAVAVNGPLPKSPEI